MKAINVELIMALFGVYDASDKMKETNKSSDLQKALKCVRDLEHRAILESCRESLEEEAKPIYVSQVRPGLPVCSKIDGVEKDAGPLIGEHEDANETQELESEHVYPLNNVGGDSGKVT